MDIERTMLWAGLLALLFIYLAFQTAMARDENSSCLLYTSPSPRD